MPRVMCPRPNSPPGLDSEAIYGFNTPPSPLGDAARIAQSVEQGIENPRVGSSILSPGTIYHAGFSHFSVSRENPDPTYA
jgi:hypothetical protein